MDLRESPQWSISLLWSRSSWPAESWDCFKASAIRNHVRIPNDIGNPLPIKVRWSRINFQCGCSELELGMKCPFPARAFEGLLVPSVGEIKSMRRPELISPAHAVSCSFADLFSNFPFNHPAIWKRFVQKNLSRRTSGSAPAFLSPVKIGR